MQGPQARMLDARRLHLNHGPIDLIAEAWGKDQKQALKQAQDRFQSILTSLVDELELLRKPLNGEYPSGPVAKRMTNAVALFDGFVTPMAAVAGAVADEICVSMCQGCRLERAYVNNGGDIAVYLDKGQTLNAAIPGLGQVLLSSEHPARGVATSGWRGRSHSLGIADAVTVLAKTAATADVAATLIANAVNLADHAGISRKPAHDLQPDSDLGAQLVTVGVGALSPHETQHALEGGKQVAQQFLQKGHITAAALFLNDQSSLTEGFPSLEETDPLHS